MITIGDKVKLANDDRIGRVVLLWHQGTKECKSPTWWTVAVRWNEIDPREEFHSEDALLYHENGAPYYPI